MAFEDPECVEQCCLAWDLCGTDFGSRQALYERFFNGDVVRLRQTRFQTYDYTRAAALDRLLTAADRIAGWS